MSNEPIKTMQEEYIEFAKPKLQEIMDLGKGLLHYIIYDGGEEFGEMVCAYDNKKVIEEWAATNILNVDLGVIKFIQGMSKPEVKQLIKESKIRDLKREIEQLEAE